MAQIRVGDRPSGLRDAALPSPGIGSAASMTNMALRFVVEMAAYAALGFWGATNPSPLIVRVALATLTPLAAMVLWSLLLAPKARWRQHDPLAMVLELAVFAGAAVAIGVTGPVWLTEAFIAVAVANTILVRLFERRTAEAAATSQPDSAIFRSPA